MIQIHRTLKLFALSMGSSYLPLIFNIFKPKGLASFDVIRKLKRMLPKNVRKIGHFGTLDPFAEGVLLVGMSGASRLNNFVHQELPKTYIATGKLGIRTSTGDLEGEVLETSKVSNWSKEEWQKCAYEKFLGKYLQEPHPYSSTKHRGRPLYHWARKGVILRKDAVEREIYDFTILSLKEDEVTFSVTVSSGTYIRVLFEEISTEARCPGHLTSLKRIAIGPHLSTRAIQLESFSEKEGLWDLNLGMTPEQLLPFDSINLEEFGSKLFRGGQKLDIAKHLNHLPNIPSHYFWVRSNTGSLLGLAKVEEGRLSSQWNYPQ